MDELDERLRRASVNSLESDSAARAPTPPADLDAPLLPPQTLSGGLPADAEGAAQLMEEAARSSYKSRLRRRQQTHEQQTTTCGQRQRRCRHRVEHWLDHSVTQTILVLLVLAETAAVTGELMIERGVLSFASCQNTCDLGLCGQYRLRPTDFKIYSTLHAVSVTILCLFEVEFLLMFYSLGFRCCCKSGAPLVLLDVLIVTTALVVEALYLANTNTSVLFVLVLRIVRILNGLFQQGFRNHEIQERKLEEAEAGLHERYHIQMQHLIVQADRYPPAPPPPPATCLRLPIFGWSDWRVAACRRSCCSGRGAPSRRWASCSRARAVCGGAAAGSGRRRSSWSGRLKRAAAARKG